MQKIDNYLISEKKSERGELLNFFIENLRNKEGKKYSAKIIAVKLSHLSKEDLYYLVSISKDTLRRKGHTAFQKFFWWSIKCK